MTDTMAYTPGEIGHQIRVARDANVPIFLWGPPGIGKSEVAKQLATDLGIAFADIRLSQMDPTDLRGIPYPHTTFGVRGVSWSSPRVLPHDIDVVDDFEVLHADTLHINFSALNPVGTNGIYYVRKPTIKVRAVATENTVAAIIAQTPHSVEVALFKTDAAGKATDQMVAGIVRVTITGRAEALIGLEEFNAAPLSIQAASYELVLDRRLGEYRVPTGCYLMAMGNRETDKGIAFKMVSPLRNRFAHLEQRADFEEFQGWAFSNNIHPEVIGYLSAFKHHLFQMEDSSAARGFPTPRSWSFLSRLLYNVEFMPDRLVQGLVCGAIGDGVGLQFMEFRRLAADLPKADDILSGELVKLAKEPETALQFALTTTLCYELKQRSEANRRKHGDKWQSSPERKQWLKEADLFIEFVMQNFRREICIMGARAAITVHRLPFDVGSMKNFKVFAAAYKSVIV